MDNGSNLKTRDIVIDFVQDYLRQRGHNWTPTGSKGSGASAGRRRSSVRNSESLQQVCQSLKDFAKELQTFIQNSFNETFERTTRLEVNDYEQLEVLANELFNSQISWSGIITFLVHGAALAERAISNTQLNADIPAESRPNEAHQTNGNHDASRGDQEVDEQEEEEEEATARSTRNSHDNDELGPQPKDVSPEAHKMVSKIIDWICTYIDENLMQWILEQESGWLSLKEHAAKTKSGKNSDISNGFKAMRHHFGVAAFAVFVGGLYLCSKFTVQS